MGTKITFRRPDGKQATGSAAGPFRQPRRWCTLEAVDKFEAGLKAAGKRAEVYRYDADHGFVNEQRDAHSRGCRAGLGADLGILGGASGDRVTVDVRFSR